jgi:ribonuclease BN (tRNA processing enzyme)
MEDYHLPICTHCYAVRVEPHRKNMKRPTCMDCGEVVAKQVVHTSVPMNKSNHILVTDLSLLKQLNPKRTT